MANERLDLRKEVFDKTQYVKTINTRFNELGSTSITEDLINKPTVQEFFGLYNTLFYDIPALGETDSHEYLAKTSGDYINFENISDEIAALQAEISQLRTDLLAAQMENIGSVVNDDESKAMIQNSLKEIQDAGQTIINTETTTSNNTQTSTGGGGGANSTTY